MYKELICRQRIFTYIKSVHWMHSNGSVCIISTYVALRSSTDSYSPLRFTIRTPITVSGALNVEISSFKLARARIRYLCQSHIITLFVYRFQEVRL